MKKTAYVLVTGLVLLFSVGATAPRFAPDWFSKGEENPPIVIAHEYPPYRSVSIEGNGFHTKMIKAVFARAGANVDVDIQSAKSLVMYALVHENTMAVIGEETDFSDISGEQFVSIPFHVKAGRYFYYCPAHDKTMTWGGELENMRGRMCGLETAPEGEAYKKAGIAVIVGDLPSLLGKLKAGEIDFVGADTGRAEWTLDTHFPEDKKSFVAMKIPAWVSFSLAVFNTRQEYGALFADRFGDAMRLMLKDGTYDLLLKNGGRDRALPADHRKKLEDYLDSLNTSDTEPRE